MSNRRQKTVGALMLLCAALIWGTTFVAQDKAAAHVEGFTFLFARSALAVAALLPAAWIKTRFERRKTHPVAHQSGSKRALLIGGALCGALLFVASALQQFGIAANDTSPGKDAFITALYIVFVPVLGLFFKKRCAPHVYACVAVALVGLWLLCMGNATLSRGDLLVILCSLIFAFHIMAVDALVPRVDGVWLSLCQFGAVTLLSFIFMWVFESPSWSDICAAAGPILFAAILSSAGAYTLQILGQSRTPPTLAGLLMSLESVFAVLCSMLLLPEVPAPTAREWGGMALILAAILAAQLQGREKKSQKF